MELNQGLNQSKLTSKDFRN